MNIDINSLFEYSFVISVDDERLSVFRRRFQKEGLPIPRIFRGFQYKNGVYRSAGIVKTRDAANVRLSNLALVKVAEALNWPFVCIFEDDALPCIEVKKKLEAMLQDLPDDIDMLKLGWLCKKEAIKMTESLCKAQTLGSHAYIVFKRYYMAFQKNAQECFCTDVLPMNDIHQNIYCTNKFLFMQDDRCFCNSVHESVKDFYFKRLYEQNELSGFAI